MMELCGLEVLATGNDGKEAVDLYKKFKPDIIFSDIRMPVYDGFYAINEIQGINDSAKIIAITADDTVITMEELSNLKIPVIVKPYTLDIVKKSLKELL